MTHPPTHDFGVPVALHFPFFRVYMIKKTHYRLIRCFFFKQRFRTHCSGQSIATNPPRSPQKVVKSKGISPKSPKHSGLGIILICPDCWSMSRPQEFYCQLICLFCCSVPVICRFFFDDFFFFPDLDLHPGTRKTTSFKWMEMVKPPFFM